MIGKQTVLIAMAGAALAVLMGSVAAGGTIAGAVRAEGKTLPDGAAAPGKYESRKSKFFDKVDYSRMKDFVVWLETTNRLTFPKPEAPVRIVVQKDATFRPHVMPVLVGTTVEWPNEDDIYHNVFSFSDAKSFDLGLYREEVKRVTFEKPGRVDIFCSIHKNMSCVILVLENPWFATTGADGRYEIRNVPPGRYRIKAWHERLPPQVRDVDVTEHGTNAEDFVLGVTGLPAL